MSCRCRNCEDQCVCVDNGFSCTDACQCKRYQNSREEETAVDVDIEDDDELKDESDSKDAY